MILTNTISSLGFLQTVVQVAEQLSELREQQAGEASSEFPFHEFEILRKASLLGITLPDQALDFQRGHSDQLLQLLKFIGKGNLSVGRIYEGHINALYLTHLFGTTEQKNGWYRDADQFGHLFGVWNTQMHDGVTIQTIGNGQYRLLGCKSFCSGSHWIARPIITGQLLDEAGRDLGWQMVIVPIDQQDNLPVDASFWKPLGMQASVSHKIDFTDILISEQDLLGQPNDYHQQPYFSGGAVRFAAVHLGGAEAIYDATRQYLQKLGRTEDPYQCMRLGEMATLIETGNLWINNAGKQVDADLSDEQIINYANMTRTVTEKIGLDIMQLAERCVGARGLLYPEPFARLHADLTTYLRQPAPDQALAQIGTYVGSLTHPTHDFWNRTP